MNKKIKIAVANDHAGYKTKLIVCDWLKANGYEVENFGTDSEESCDYPDFAHPLAEAVENGTCRFGITICGSGNGINITANKHQGIRAALCWNVEISHLARLHNNANVCSIPGRYVNADLLIEIVQTFLTSEFEGGRHQKRIDKIPLK